jgi:hypothetical protein
MIIATIQQPDIEQTHEQLWSSGEVMTSGDPEAFMKTCFKVTNVTIGRNDAG